MKHGEKAQAKSATAIKASENKSSNGAAQVRKAKAGKEVAGEGKGPKGPPQSKGGKEASGKNSPAVSAKTAVLNKTSASKSASKNALKFVAAENGEVRFSNPIVEAAYKHALSRYPVALKRLSD